MSYRRLLLIGVDDAFERAVERAAPRGAVLQRARTVQEGIELLESARPDLLIVDDPLPDMEALDALEPIVAAHPNLRLFFVTSRHSHALELRVRRLGALFYTAKPVSGRSLRKILAP